MRKVPVLIKILVPVLGIAAILTIRSIVQVNPPHTSNASVGDPLPVAPAPIQLCSGGLSVASSGQAQPQSGPKPHSVTLSWNPSIPASHSPRDVIKGYFVFRSQTSQTYADSNRINSLPLIGTQCIDTAVEPRTTYYYVVKALAASGEQSVASKEIKAVIPFP